MKVNLVILMVFVRVESHPDENLSAAQYIQKHGYPFEAHTYSTEDGYLLTAHRIPYGTTTNHSREVALLVHGMGGGGENFIFTGTRPKNSLAFYLADRGYDVWLFNARGTSASRKHNTLDPDRDSGRFWDFSWHEMGVYDLPATIEYIQKETGVQSVFYVGHSQGTTVLLVMLSWMPQMNAKIRVAVLLAPTVFLHDISSPYLVSLARFFPLLQRFLEQANWYELPVPKNPNLLNGLMKVFCTPQLFQSFCIDFFGIIAGGVLKRFNKTQLPVIVQYAPQGLSLKQPAHYAQSLISGEFKPFDHGPKRNFQLFNSPKPQHYNLSNCKAPMALFYSPDDPISNIRMVDKFAIKLPNVVLKHKVAVEGWNHLDYIMAFDLKEIVNEPLYEVFKAFQ